jgi:hypothetical protein
MFDKEGAGALVKSRASLLLNIAETQAKIEKYKNTGHISSLERELRTFQDQIAAIDSILAQ